MAILMRKSQIKWIGEVMKVTSKINTPENKWQNGDRRIDRWTLFKVGNHSPANIK